MSFFSNIVRSDEPEHIRRKTPEQQSRELVRSIKQNLEVMLNARHGCSSGTPDFGMRDLNDSVESSVSLSADIVDEIKRSITLFEPRVRVEDIIFSTDENDPTRMTFRLSCAVKLASHQHVSEAEFDLMLKSTTQQFKAV